MSRRPHRGHALVLALLLAGLVGAAALELLRGAAAQSQLAAAVARQARAGERGGGG